MELVKDKGDQVLYNKLDMAYSSSDEETEETDVMMCLPLEFHHYYFWCLSSHILWCSCREKEMTSI